MNDNLITVVIPAYNEEGYIEQTLNAINNWAIKAEVIVVNDGSTDRTEQILKGYDVIAFTLKKNRGKGQALMEGIKNANGDVLLFLDADLGQSAKEAEKLIYPILEGKADMTIAILPKAKTKGGFGLVKNFAQKGIYFLTGFNATAPLSGQRAMKREIIEQLQLVDGFGIEVGLTIDTIRKGYSIVEVEVPLSHRETGRDLKGFVHRGKEFVAVFKALFLKWRQKPL